jgi:hypothetical protein
LQETLQNAPDRYLFQSEPPSESAQLHATASRVPLADDLLVKLTAKQQVAVELIALGKTDSTVAAMVAVHPKTVTKWRLYHPGFRAEVARRQHEVWGAAGERLRRMLEKALDTIAEGMGHANPYVKLFAAKGLLMLARRFAPPDVPIDPVAVLEQHARLIHQSFKSTDGAVEPLDELDITWAERDLIHKLEGGAGMPKVERDPPPKVTGEEGSK